MATCVQSTVMVMTTVKEVWLHSLSVTPIQVKQNAKVKLFFTGDDNPASDNSSNHTSKHDPGEPIKEDTNDMQLMTVHLSHRLSHQAIIHLLQCMELMMEKDWLQFLILSFTDIVEKNLHV